MISLLGILIIFSQLLVLKAFLVNQPALSIVICTYNRDNYLQHCLDHLSRQSIPNNLFEILVINNQSTDNTEAVCLKFQEDHPEILFKYHTETRQGLSYCRNTGIAESKADIIAFIDDDAYADQDFATNLIAYFREHPEVDAIGGRVTPDYHSRPPSWMSKYLLPLVAALDKGEYAKPFKGFRFPIGANMAFRRSIFPETEAFHTGLGRKGSFLGSGEEKDLFYRLKRQKGNIHYVPTVHVRHSIPETRLESDYIKRMAKGIGKSEAVRINQGPFHIKAGKWCLEFLKIAATGILALLYCLKGEWPKANMLIKFRWWFLGGFIKG